MRYIGDEKTEEAPVKGWYATQHCYDAMEGAFPSGMYWDGECWKWEETDNSRAGVFVQCVPEILCSSKEEAEKLAKDLDLGF